MQGTNLGVIRALPLAGCITPTKSPSMRPGKGEPWGTGLLQSFPPPAPPSHLFPALPLAAAWLKRLWPLPHSALQVHIHGAHKAQTREDKDTHRPDIALGTRGGSHYPGTVLMGSHPTLAQTHRVHLTHALNPSLPCDPQATSWPRHTAMSQTNLREKHSLAIQTNVFGPLEGVVACEEINTQNTVDSSLSI